MTADSTERVLGIDVARGLAVLLMIQTHAYDAWVRPELRTGLAFRVTRTLGTFPLPTFLVLAGLGLALRSKRGGAGHRGQVIVSGLRVALTGALLSVSYALLDGGQGLDRFLHVDILHAIGLSLVVLAVSGLARPWSLASASLALLVLAVALCAPLTRLGHGATGITRYLAAPFVEVPGLSSMPVVPLIAFCAFGVLVEPRLSMRPLRLPFAAASLAVIAAVQGGLGLGLIGALSRSEPNIAWNVLDLCARASLLILASLAWASRPGTTRARERTLSALALLGRTSLFVYAIHLPFCYGRLASPLKRSLGMPEATLFLAALCAACFAVACLRDTRTRARLYSTLTSS